MRLRSPFHRSEYIFLLLVAAYVGICAFAAQQAGLGERFYPLMYMERCVVMTTFLGLVYFFFSILRVIYLLIKHRPKKPLAFLWQDFKAGPFNLERHWRALPIFAGFIFFFSTFTSMKMLIAGFHPFAWDHEFAVLDRILHFGIDPWRILQPFLGHPLITYAINLNYNTWLIFLFAALYWQLFTLANPLARMHFFYAFFFSWIINGTLLAIVFSSGGPCFFEGITGSLYYADLMNYLRGANEYMQGINEKYVVFAVPTQENLWKAASNKEVMLGGGISAMPSIHVTSSLMFWLLAKEIKTKHEWMFKVFFWLILIGSVHLAWHYAIDGYLAIIITLAIWKLTGVLVKKIGVPPRWSDTAKN